MLETKTKLEILEKIAKSDEVTACEQVCIISNILPADTREKIANCVMGMIMMAESINNKK